MFFVMRIFWGNAHAFARLKLRTAGLKHRKGRCGYSNSKRLSFEPVGL